MQSDWSSFIPGLIIEFTSVFVFGIIVAGILEYQRRRFEDGQAKEISDEARLKYLIHMREEIRTNLEAIPYQDNQDGIQERLAEFGKTFLTVYQTTYWDAFVPSGLLPTLIDYSLLKGIAEFYHTLRILNSHFQNLKSMILVSGIGGSSDKYAAYVEEMLHEKQFRDYFLKLVIPLMKQAQEEGNWVLKRIESEIDVLQRIT
jgi:hypothetical protein